MSYKKQDFVDRVIDNSGKVVTEGTKLTAAHLQHIEEGIVDAEAVAITAQSMASSATNNANSARTTASSASSLQAQRSRTTRISVSSSSDSHLCSSDFHL